MFKSPLKVISVNPKIVFVNYVLCLFYCGLLLFLSFPFQNVDYFC